MAPEGPQLLVRGPMSAQQSAGEHFAIYSPLIFHSFWLEYQIERGIYSVKTIQSCHVVQNGSDAIEKDVDDSAVPAHYKVPSSAKLGCARRGDLSGL